MKRLFILMVSFASSALCALPVGNPIDASLYTNGICTGGSLCDPCDPCFQWSDQFQVRIGYYGDYVFNRNMTSKVDSGNVRKTQLMTNAALMVINLCNRIDVFWTLGQSVIELNSNGSVFSSDSTAMSIQYQPYFSWSVGGRATIGQWRKIHLGVETQFFRTRPNIDSVIRYADGDIAYLSYHNNGIYEEWQVGIGCAYTATWAIPYIAIKSSAGRLKMDNYLVAFEGGSVVYTLHDLIQRQACGYAVGMTFVFNETTGITFEGRFANEKALYILL